MYKDKSFEIQQKIIDAIKKTLKDFNEKNMHSHMLKHYKILRLMDDEGNWVTSKLQKISLSLLPNDYTEKKSQDFVEEMARIANHNNYLINFFEMANGQSFELLQEKFALEGNKVIPDIVAYSLVLERLTKAMRNDPGLINECLTIFETERENSDFFNKMSLFYKVKLISVEGSIKNIFIKSHETGIVSKDAGSLMLPLNIFEAVVGDFLMGNRDNAKAGMVLVTKRPGKKKEDPITGEGHTRWFSDKRALSFYLPLSKNWTDLYQTWNMAFVSQARNFPYLLPKLLIPQVANYKNETTTYIYNRALALYLFLNHAIFEKMEKMEKNEKYIQWDDKKLTSLWGKANLKSAKQYQETLADTKKNKRQDVKGINRKKHKV